MFRYTNQALLLALEEAALDLNVEVDEIYYHVVDQNEEQVIVDVYTILDVERFAKHYIEDYINHLYLDSEVKTKIDKERILVNVNCENNSVLIGKNGQTLRSLVILTRQATQHQFKKRFEVIIDINHYKERRYQKIIAAALEVAKSVQETKITAALDPMPNDERLMIHQALQSMPNVKTESKGSGQERHLTISYVETKVEAATNES